MIDPNLLGILELYIQDILNTYIVYTTVQSFQQNIGRCDIEGLAQDCSNSIANALELLQSCAKFFIWPSLG